MFVGHLAVSFGAKAVEPKAPLGALVAASFALDLLWPLLLLTGLEVVQVAPGNTAFTPLAFESYPWSHSLLMALVWGVAGGGVTYVALKTPRAAALVGMVVVSHWVLDFVTHRPDLPLWQVDQRWDLAFGTRFRQRSCWKAASSWRPLRSTPELRRHGTGLAVGLFGPLSPSRG